LTPYRDGKDGPWSTFRIEVGTPSQQVRVIPASSQSSTWLVLPEACPDSKGKDCAANRGLLYKRNVSSTWGEYGSYHLNTILEERVGLSGDGLYGYETLSLGWTGDNLPSLKNQLVAGIITSDFYLGSLSLSPRPSNFTDFNNPIPSFMQDLRNSSTPIPSLSWSYTAGAFNLAPKVFGSLILGGYDSTRFQSNDIIFPFGNDISLDFQVAIQSVTTNITDTPLLSTGIISYIDSLVPDIWLPIKTCQLFERAFGLIWNDTTELYLMNDTLHESLLEKNPIVSFKVGPQVSGASIIIDMPYWNFYQTATSAYVGNSSGLYFPLKRAANDSQYVLGRTFLQSAHISADYERSIFNLSQALYPSSSTEEKIVAVLPPLEENSPGEGANSNLSDSSGIGTGAIAGITVGAFVLLVIIATGIFIMYRRKKKAKSEEAHELDDTDVQKTQPHEVPGDDLKYEVGEGLRHEVPGDMNPTVELSAGRDQMKPAEADGTALTIYEMPGEGPKYVEMDGEGLVLNTLPILDAAVPATAPSLRGTYDSEVPEWRYDDEAPLTPPAARELR
jgi:hypothetical protein